MEKYQEKYDFGEAIHNKRQKEAAKKFKEFEKEAKEVFPLVLICENCKEYWIAPKLKCPDCGSTTLSHTDSSNRKFAKDYLRPKKSN